MAKLVGSIVQRTGFKVGMQTCLRSDPFSAKNISCHLHVLVSFSVRTCGFGHASALRAKYSEYVLCNTEILTAILLLWYNQ